MDNDSINFVVSKGENKKYEASKIEGGKIVKGFVGGVNIASKALRPVLLSLAYPAKKIYNSRISPNITGRILGWGEGKGLRATKGTYKQYKKAYRLNASKVVITNKITNKKIMTSPVASGVGVSCSKTWWVRDYPRVHNLVYCSLV